MNDSNFEEYLRRRPLRSMPAHWRKEILSATPQRTPIAVSSIRRVLWPNPWAWAGLAATWAIILLLNVSSEDRSTTKLTMRATQLDWREERMTLAAQRREWMESADTDSDVAPKSQASPRGPLGPRSEQRSSLEPV